MHYYLLFFLLFEIVVHGLPDGLSSWTLVNDWANTPSTGTIDMGIGYNAAQNTVWFFGGYIDSTVYCTNYIVKFNVSSKEFEYNPSKWQLPAQWRFGGGSEPSSATMNDIVYVSPTHEN
eukprot:276705_1